MSFSPSPVLTKFPECQPATDRGSCQQLWSGYSWCLSVRVINWHQNRFPSHWLYPVLSSYLCKTQHLFFLHSFFAFPIILSFFAVSLSLCRPLMCTGVDGSSFSVRSPATSHNRLTSTNPQTVLHFLSSVQWNKHSFIFLTAQCYYSIIIYVHHFLPLSISLVALLSPRSLSLSLALICIT